MISMYDLMPPPAHPWDERHADAIADRPLSANMIKLLAIAAMTCNHVANIFLESGTPAHLILQCVGYMTCPTMCYMLVEGFHYTHSRARYALRLLVFAVIAQFPYQLAFGDVLSAMQLNILFTLLVGVAMMAIMDAMDRYRLPVILQAMAGVAVALLTSDGFDWGLLGPLFVMMFWLAHNQRHKLQLAWFGAIGVMTLLYLTAWARGGVALPYVVGYLAAFAVVATLFMRWYNGKRSNRADTPSLVSRAVAQWGFYIYYPAHLAILAALHMLL